MDFISSRIQPVNPQGNQSWIFVGRTDAEAETSILSSPDAKNWCIGKDLDARKDLRQEKGTTEDEKVGWHHRLNGRISTGSGSWWWIGRPGVLQSMGSLSQTQLNNWTELNWTELRMNYLWGSSCGSKIFFKCLTSLMS